MIALIAEMYVVAVAVAGFLIGLSLSHRLRNENQLTIRPPSPFKQRQLPAVWIESPSLA